MYRFPENGIMIGHMQYIKNLISDDEHALHLFLKFRLLLINMIFVVVVIVFVVNIHGMLLMAKEQNGIKKTIQDPLVTMPMDFFQILVFIIFDVILKQNQIFLLN